MQATLATPARFTGAGLHSGKPARLVINPAPAGHGVVFRRTDLGGLRIPARWDHVVPSPLCTLLKGENGVTVSTVEHVMAALAGTGVHNALIDIDGPEVPILDGSSAPFVAGILKASLRHSAEPLRATLFSGQSVRTDKTGWYLRKNRSLAIGEDGAYYVLTVPGGLRERLSGVQLQPSPPPLIVGKGGRDGESGSLTDFLRWRLDAG